MSYNELKLIMRGKARLAKGFVNLLKDDAAFLYDDVDKFKVERIEEDIREIKQTATQLIDIIADLEYYLYLAKRDSIEGDAK